MSDKKKHGLGVLPATAICGNDITSSCLYVSALSIIYSGKYAPIALLIVAAVLYLFRKIYGEVVGALPLNGGAYNALLNTTSKAWASLAACLTLLSYMATAVISASEAMHYLHSLVHNLPIVIATIILLGIFCVLTIIGITESAVVAIGIFLFHLSSLTLLALIGAYHVFGDGTGLDTLWANLATTPEGGMTTALFFGFAAAMLGISGFESSANFVEEQRPGVFPKTLRNMWVAVSVFNPLMAILALALIPIADVAPHKEQLLAHMGQVASGDWLRFLISIDAVLVLSGAVLTSYVGVTGLIRRMTLDRCLPQWLLKTNKRGSSHRIILAFFALSVSVLMLTQGNLPALAGVYTISFLAVMALFGIGNILLKVRRARLPRPEKASWPAIILAISAVFTALVGNILLEPKYLKIFLIYFLPTALIISIMLWRIGLLKLALAILDSITKSLGRITGNLSTLIHKKIDEINSQEIVFFTNEDDLPSLNRAMLYVESNEHTNRIRFVTVVPEGDKPPKGLKEDLAFLDRAYPDIDIDFVVEEGSFGPQMINRLSKKWRIPKNFMFIGSPGDHFPYGLAQLGGVRLII
jgi:amino acid transporter